MVNPTQKYFLQITLTSSAAVPHRYVENFLYVLTGDLLHTAGSYQVKNFIGCTYSGIRGFARYRYQSGVQTALCREA